MIYISWHLYLTTLGLLLTSNTWRSVENKVGHSFAVAMEKKKRSREALVDTTFHTQHAFKMQFKILEKIHWVSKPINTKGRYN